MVEPILSGDYGDAITDDDLEYARDLGLVALDDPIRIANPIYAEVVPRVVASRAQRAMHEPTAPYVREGRLDLEKLLEAFQEWFRENSEHWRERFGSYEAGPQLLLHSFLHRVVNGGGWIHREQPLGAGRADLLIVWPDRKGDGARRYVVECKLARRGGAAGGCGGAPADGGVHGPLRCGERPPGGVRSRRRPLLGGEDLPPHRGTRGQKRSPSGACKRRSPGVRYSEAMRFFNRMGPVEREEHYCIPPLETGGSGGDPHPGPPAGVLRRSRTAADGENLDPAGAPRPAELGVRGGLPLRVCEPGGRADGGGATLNGR